MSKRLEEVSPFSEIENQIRKFYFEFEIIFSSRLTDFEAKITNFEIKVEKCFDIISETSENLSEFNQELLLRLQENPVEILGSVYKKIKSSDPEQGIICDFFQ